MCYLGGQYLFFNGAVFWVLGYAEHWTHAAVPPGVRHVLGGMNGWARAAIVILLGDFLIYWGHRMQHRVGFLWRFHAIHHSAEHLDWLAAHREHPVDSLYTIFLVNLPIFALGFPIHSLIYFAAFRGLWAIFIHSNVRLPIGPLRMILGAPELHHWHHERSRESGNYANVSPIMDLLFGTYRCPDHEPAAFGIEETMPTGYLGQLVHPFRPGARSAEPHRKGELARDALCRDEVTAIPSPAPARVLTAHQSLAAGYDFTRSAGASPRALERASRPALERC